jgi:hypothetical protein
LASYINLLLSSPFNPMMHLNWRMTRG